MRKLQSTGGASVREQKAAALDALIRQEIDRKRAADAVKTARLKALRLARDAAENGAAPDTTTAAAEDTKPAAEADTKPTAQEDETPK
jgi:hypothetical protein